MQITETAAATTTAIERTEPRVFDTYALVYAYALILLLPGLLLASTAGYKSYSPTFLLGVMGPFALGVIAVFMTDAVDPFKTRLIRAAVLMPIVSMTGVAIMFGTSIALVPLSPWIRVENFESLTVVAAVVLAVVLLPLPTALFNRLRGPRSARTMVQSFVLVLGLALTAGVAVIMVRHVGLLGEYLRKDMQIYLVGAVGWYLPSFGLAAGLWRKLGIV